MMPNTSWDKRVTTFAWDGSGRNSARRDPAPVIISCSFVPANWPKTACTMLVGGWIVKEHKNMFEVVAMIAVFARLSLRGLEGLSVTQLGRISRFLKLFREVFVPACRRYKSLRQKFRRASARWMNDNAARMPVLNGVLLVARASVGPSVLVRSYWGRK